jgi:phage shock protein A
VIALEQPVWAGFALAAIPVLIGVWFSRGKTASEAAKAITDAAVALSNSQVGRIAALEQQVAALTATERQCRTDLARLSSKVEQLTAALAAKKDGR